MMRFFKSDYAGQAYRSDENKITVDKLKKITDELNRQNNLLTTLFNNLKLGIFMVDAPSGKPLAANKMALELLGRGILPDSNRHNLVEVYKARKADSYDPYPTEEMPIILGMKGIS